MNFGQQAAATATKEQVEAKVREYWADAHPQSVTATKEFAFSNGFLWSVTIMDEKGEPRVNYCYTVGSDIDRFDTLGELARAVGRRHNIMSLIYSVLDVGGIAGIIAIIITVTLCLMALFGRSASDEKVITALTLALGSVMGFYFGKKSDQGE